MRELVLGVGLAISVFNQVHALELTSIDDGWSLRFDGIELNGSGLFSRLGGRSIPTLAISFSCRSDKFDIIVVGQDLADISPSQIGEVHFRSNNESYKFKSLSDVLTRDGVIGAISAGTSTGVTQKRFLDFVKALYDFGTVNLEVFFPSYSWSSTIVMNRPDQSRSAKDVLGRIYSGCSTLLRGLNDLPPR